MATGSRATDKWFKDKKQEQATAPTGRATDKWFQQAGQNSDYYKFHNIGTGSATRSLSDIYGTETTRRTSASAPVIPEAEQKRQTERESASTARDNAKNRLNELEGEKSRLAGYVTDDFSASLYADRLAELDRQIAEARTTHEAAKQEYDKVYTDYNAARKELKEAEAAARSAERSNAYNSTERKKEADERVAKARAAYSEQGGDPDADWLSANLKQWGAGMLGTLRYGQELNRPENAIKLGPVTIGGGDDRMPAEMRAAIEAKQKADYEEKYGAGTWKPAYQRTEETAARMQREAAEDLSSIKAGRSELAQFGIDVAGQSVQMGLDAAFNVGKVIPGGSLTAMALRTFGASAQEAKDEGATLAQQGLYGAGSAAVEVLTERMFDGVAKIYGAGVADDLVSHMVGKFTKNRLGQVALGWAFDAIGEGFEEVVSDLANPFLRSIYDKDVASNLYTGSFADRWSGYWGQIDPAEVGYDFLVGAAMGFAGGSVENVGRATGIVAEDERSKFFMEAGQSGMQFKDAVKMWKQHLIKEGYATQTQDTEVTNQANEYLARLGEGKKVKERDINKLNERALNVIANEDIANTKTAVQQRLHELGVDDERLAQAVAAIALEDEAKRIGARGFNVTEEQRALVENSKEAKRVLFEMDVENLRGERRAEIDAFVKSRTDGATREDYTRAVEPYARTNEWVKTMQQNKALATDVYGAKMSVSEAEKTATVSFTNKKGNTISGQIVGINKDGTLRVKHGKDGKTIQSVAVDQVKGISENYRMLLEAAASRENGNVMLQAYRPGQDIPTFLQQWDLAQNVYGPANFTNERARGVFQLRDLTDTQLDLALEMGRQAAQNRQQQGEAVQEKLTGELGFWEGGKIDGVEYDGVTAEEAKKLLGDAEYGFAADVLAKVVNVTLIKSREVDGNLRGAQGIFYRNGHIYLDVNAGMNNAADVGKRTIVLTAAHELTHYIKAYNEDAYKTLESFITDELTRQGKSLEDLMEQKQRRANWSLEPEEAMEEVIADACEMMLTDAEQITAFANEHAAEARTIWGWLDKFFTRIENAFKGLTARHEEAQAMQGRITELRKMWLEALAGANENALASQEGGVDDIVDEIQSVLPEWEAAHLEGKKAKYAEREQNFDTSTNTNKEYSATIDEIVGVAEVKDPEKRIRVRDKTPQVILDNDESAKDLPILMRYDTAYLATRKAGTIKGHYHNLGEARMKELPSKLENPILMLKFPSGKINSVIQMSDERGRKVLVSVELNAWNTKSGEKSHLILTVFGTSENYIQNQIKENGAKVIYENKTEEAAHFISGLSDTTGNDLDASPKSKITQGEEKVKRSDRDVAYSEAVANNDMDMAAHLVEQAAEIAMPDSKMRTKDGKLRKFYHGTYSKDFTEFDPNLIGTARDGDTGFFGRGFYFAYSRGEARAYGSRVIEAYLNITNPFNFQTELNTLNGETRFDYNTGRAVFVVNFAEKFPELAKDKTIGTFDNKGNWKEISFADFAKEYRKVMDTVEFKTEELDGAYGKEWLVTADPREESFTNEAGETFRWMEYGYQQRYIDEEMANNKAINAFAYLEKTMYPGIHMPSMAGTIMETDFTEELKRRGFDGAIQSEDGDEAVAFYPEQIKSADPVTYDDDGNVIPLEERFDQGKKDIRYSLRDNSTVQKTKEHYQERLDKLRAEKNEKIAEIRKEETKRRQEAVKKEKAAKWEKVEETKDRYRGMMENQRKKRSDTAVRGKIKALHKELNDILLKPKEGRYVPKELVKATADILGSIDTTSARAVKAKAAMAELKIRYDALAKEEKYALAYDETVSGMIQQIAEELGDVNIYELTGSQLEGVYNTLKALKHTIVTANKLVGAKIEADAFEAANQMMNETANAKGIPTKLLRKFIMAQMTPSSAFRMFGGYKKNSMWEQMFNELNNGQLTQTQILMEGGQIFRELIDDKKNMAKLHDQKNLVDIGLKDDQGNAIKVTRGMMLSVYMHLLNEQNARHVAYGGLTVPRLKQYYKNQMKDAFNGKTGRAVAFAAEIAELNRQLETAETAEERDAIKEQLAELNDKTDAYMSNLLTTIEENLTDYDRKWIAAAQEFFDVYSKGKLNEVTEMVYGFEKAQVDNYFPIHTDPDYRAASFDTIVRDMNLENAGFMKERVNGANPILLEDITDVISSQLRRTAQYVGLMPAIRNFNKAYGKARAGYPMSVQSAMGRTFENEGKKYIENLMADLNGARKTEANIFDELRGNMAGAVLTLNPRVALSQTASYPTAAAEIGYKPLIKALKDIKNNPNWNEVARDEVAKWTPLWWYRMQGFSTVELGDIKNNEQALSKVLQKMKWATGWIQFMDGATTGALWQASKYYVDDNFSDLEKGSDEYMIKVAETFNRVLEKTQPDYTTMQRPDILRNPNAIFKQLTMFMTQRLQNTNILYDAAATYAHYVRDADSGRNGVTAEDVKQARTRLAWAVSSQIAAGASIVIFKAIADAIMHNLKAYRDDDDELTAESVSRTLLTNFTETLTSNILWGSELFSAMKAIVTGERYYGISLNGVDTFKDILEDGVKTLSKAWRGDWESAKAPAWKLGKAIAQFFGIPLGNTEKIVTMVENHVEDAKNGTFWQQEAGVDRTRAQNTHLLFNALQSGDTAKAERIRATFTDKKDEQSALKGYIRELYTGKDQKIQKAETVRLLQQYAGMTKRAAEDTAQEWTMEVVTGIKFSDLHDRFISGEITKAKAEKYYRDYSSNGRTTQAEAEAKIREWSCEKDTGIAYSDIATEVKTGRLSAEKAIQMIMKYGGKDENAATKTVNSYAIEHEYDIKPGELEDEYIAGNVTDEDATDILLRYKYYGKDEAETKAGDELERLKFMRENPGAEDVSVTQVRNYRASGLEGFVSAQDYLLAAKMMGTFEGTDLDNDGKMDRYSAIIQRLEYIDTFDLTPEQKTALAIALGMNEKTVRRKAPWN